MKFTVVGVGPGDPELVTLKALRIIKEADVVLTPYSPRGKFSVAEQIAVSYTHLDVYKRQTERFV